MEDTWLNLWKGRLVRFCALVWQRFLADRCWRMAAGLSYTSLLAVVPLSAIVFSMFTAFPVFEGVRERFQSAVFSNLLPSSAEALSGYLDQFVANTTSLSAVGIIALTATAVLLLGAIEADMNVIFRARHQRPIVRRLLVFWAMITFGPILLGASFSLTTYFFVSTQWLGLDIDSGPLGMLGRFVPSSLIIAGLIAFFMVIPNRQVRFKSALSGAIISGVLFVLLRKVFGWYVATFPTYQNVYGTLSVVPIFLIWMYLSWSVVLLGAVITTAAGDFWRRESRHAMGIPYGNERLITALTLLNIIFQTNQSGIFKTQSQLVNAAGLDQEMCKIELDFMHKKEFITLDTHEQYILSRDLSCVSLHDLYEALDMTLPQGNSVDDVSDVLDDKDTANNASKVWVKTLKYHMAHARSQSERALSISLLDILQPRADK